MEQSLNEYNSLQFIESMINRAKDKFSENGTLYLLWGFVVLCCCITQFVLTQYFEYERSYMVWMLTWVVGIHQVIYLRNRKKKETVKTYTGDIMGYVWLVFVICLILVIFIMQYYKALTALNPAILVLYGVPTFLSGIILKFRPLITGGIVCWLLVIPATMIPFEYQLLFIAIAVIAAWIIPGYYLRLKFKNQN